MTSPRRALGAAIAVAVTAGVLLSAAPAMAMTPVVIPGWSPADPPQSRRLFDEQMASAVYAVACHGVTASGWSSVMSDDTTYDWRSMIVTTEAVTNACAFTRDDMTVRQGDTAQDGKAWIWNSATGLGSLAVRPLIPGVYWDETPSPRIGQWVGIGGRAADGTMLPTQERRITAVDAKSFTLDEAVGAEYLGGPVVDNSMRVLGTLTSAGTQVTGSPQYCDVLFYCSDPPTAWWDITAPSAVQDLKATSRKGAVTFTWKPVADTGGATVDYWYATSLTGPWKSGKKFTATVKAVKGQRVTIYVYAINHAGAGPMLILTARGK